jgi:hypothetical protein
MLQLADKQLLFVLLGTVVPAAAVTLVIRNYGTPSSAAFVRLNIAHCAVVLPLSQRLSVTECALVLALDTTCRAETATTDTAARHSTSCWC